MSDRRSAPGDIGDEPIPGSAVDSLAEDDSSLRGAELLLLPQALGGALEAASPNEPAITTELEELQAWAEAARIAVEQAMEQLDVPQGARVALVLTDDAMLHDLNRRHRGIDRPTDVLSFRVDPSDLPEEEGQELGDVVISVPYAQRSARTRGFALGVELKLLAVHGLLHLLGHDDATDEGAAEMRRLETELGVRTAD